MATASSGTTERKLVTAIDKSTKALITAATQLGKQQEALEGLPAMAENLGQEVLAMELKLEGLKDLVEDGARDAQAELKIRIKEDESKLLAQLMAKRGFIEVTGAEFEQLSASLERQESDHEEQMRKEVGKAQGMAESKYNQAAALAESQQKLEMAEMTAELAMLRQQNQFMIRQVEEMNGTLVAERQARVEVEKARADSQGVVVNTTQAK